MNQSGGRCQRMDKIVPCCRLGLAGARAKWIWTVRRRFIRARGLL